VHANSANLPFQRLSEIHGEIECLKRGGSMIEPLLYSVHSVELYLLHFSLPLLSAQSSLRPSFSASLRGSGAGATRAPLTSQRARGLPWRRVRDVGCGHYGRYGAAAPARSVLRRRRQRRMRRQRRRRRMWRRCQRRRRVL
jgi:hypothetical protein